MSYSLDESCESPLKCCCGGAIGGVMYGSSWLADILPAIADAADTVWICDGIRYMKWEWKWSYSGFFVTTNDHRNKISTKQINDRWWTTIELHFEAADRFEYCENIANLHRSPMPLSLPLLLTFIIHCPDYVSLIPQKLSHCFHNYRKLFIFIR